MLDTCSMLLAYCMASRRQHPAAAHLETSADMSIRCLLRLLWLSPRKASFLRQSRKAVMHPGQGLSMHHTVLDGLRIGTDFYPTCMPASAQHLNDSSLKALTAASASMLALAGLQPELADAAMARFSEANFSRVSNKSGFLMGIIRSVQRDGPEGGSDGFDLLPRAVRHRMDDLIADVSRPAGPSRLIAFIGLHMIPRNVSDQDLPGFVYTDFKWRKSLKCIPWPSNPQR